MTQVAPLFHASADAYRPIRAQAADDNSIAYSFTGRRPGPVLAVILPPALHHAVAGRLARVPSLDRMHGEIRLLAGDAAQAARGEADAWMILGDAEGPRAYWRVLARASTLGIISGRGVPAAYR